MSTSQDPSERSAKRKTQLAIRVGVMIMTILLAIYVVGNLWHLHQLRQEEIAVVPAPEER